MIAGLIVDQGWIGFVEIGADQQILFDCQRAFGAGEFDAAGIAGEDGRGGDQGAKGAVRKFQESDERVFGFDFVKRCGHFRLHGGDVAPEPEQQIDGVHALIDQRAAAIERERAAPL